MMSKVRVRCGGGFHLSLMVFLGCSIFIWGGRADAQSVEWVTNGDGQWTNAANWSSFPLLPALGDDVVIDRRGQPGRPAEGWLVTLSGGGMQAVGNLVLEERLTVFNSGTDGGLTLGGTLVTSNELRLGANGRITGGLISSAGSGSVVASGIGSQSRMTGVTLSAGMQVELGHRVNIDGGLTIADDGTVRLLQSASLVFPGGPQTIDGDGMIKFDEPNGNSGYLSHTNNAQVVVGPGIQIRTDRGNGQIFGPTSASFTNLGTISADGAGRQISIGFDQSNGNANGVVIDNQGIVEALNGATVRFPTNLTSLANLSSGILTGGTWRVSANSTINFGNAAVTTNAADIVLDGPGSSFNALNSLQRNEGRLEVRGGRVFSPTGGLEFADTGTLVVRPTDPGAGAWVTPVSVPGTATLGGTLVVDPIGGYGPARGQAFPVIQAGSISGAFDELIYTGPVGPDEVARLFYTPTGVTFAVVCPADLALPAGLINFFDLSAFTTLFQARHPDADFNNDGLFNFFDFSAYLEAFNAGCP